VVAAVAVAGALACRPQPGLGPVTYTRGALVHVLDLATCREHVHRAPAPMAQPTLASGGVTVGIAVRRHGLSGSQSIVVRAGRTRRVVHRVAESFRRIPAGAPGPIMLLKLAGGWVFFALDPQGSASLAADGLRLQVVSTRGGPVRTIGPTLARDDYLAWCGGRLVYTGGGDRIATTHKQLLVAGPPDWRPTPLVRAPGRAFGSVVCAPDAKSVVVQEQRDTGTNMTSVRAHWSLWRVTLDGRRTRLTSPPAGFADDSPRFDGPTILFVRERRGDGVLYALRSGRVVGPFASLGFDLGYYGHHAWPYTVGP
jgi:hypothetical protein